ncbi:DUF4595 domain-containing protein [Dyadobacter frigoris]|uniref:DUF4595 domain-containing protein n=1 Tax=Dyadobacter frigoris TaxID=2576211 RepID=A0A4U6CX39_9BACT|nr:DUF4595 domain-containing protein [Dyadobacter frigoris]TKT89349.1 DUF4595 domain-containing protein [Dyadobacter frigoris]GLU55515.1 hypothetical protein Dfri01_49760 [Dyadobacter frigoris]
MKILRYKLTLAVELVVAIGLVSCQQDNVPTPDLPNPASAQALRDGISASIPKMYQLIKHGDATLSYYENGKLKKVSLGANIRGSYLTNITYAYSTNSIVSTLTRNSKIMQVITYSLDANTGYCYESSQIDYIPLGTNAIQEQETILSYLYNGKGQLVNVTDKKAPNSKTLFGYNVIGDLNKISYFGYSGSTPGPSLLAESTFYYEQLGGDPILDDLSPVNLEQANLPDQYLKIFGKQGKHLVKMITEKSTPGGKYYNYTLNNDGYVTSRQTYNISGGALVETRLYDYLVTEIGFHL